MDALVQIGYSAIPSLMRALLYHKKRSVRNGAALALGQIGSQDGVNALIRALKDEGASVRWGAAQALGDVGMQLDDPTLRQTIADNLAQCRDDPSLIVHRTALSALGQLGELGVPYLIESTTHENQGIRQHATEVLTLVGEPAIPLLLDALQHSDWQVRRHAAEALRLIDIMVGQDDLRAAVVESLLTAITDEMRSVRWFAVRGLQPHLRHLNHSHPELYRRVVNQLEDTLRNDQSTRTQVACVRVLGSLGPSSVPVLLDILQHFPDVRPRAEAGLQLGRLGCNEAVPHLAALLHENTDRPYDMVISNLTTALVNFRTPEAEAALQAFYRHQDELLGTIRIPWETNDEQ
jgi:HEAT repeat protein